MSTLSNPLAALLVLGVGASVGAAQNPAPNLFWQHATGDPSTVACTHVTHPQGDALPNLACLHPPVQAHPQGHDTGKTDLLGKPIVLACVHMVPPHKDGHPQPSLTCPHRLHTSDSGPLVNCVHPMPVLSINAEYQIRFMTDDFGVCSDVRSAAEKLARATGAYIGRPRPLNVFYRPPINGNPNDANDPFWSKYDGESHSIQITLGANTNNRPTIYHEMGHAMLGHQFVHTYSPGGPHNLATNVSATLAMEEGWATFVAMCFMDNANAMGRNWEMGHADVDIPFDVRNEYRVGCILWDLWDNKQETVSANDSKLVPDTLSLKFADLFRVYSPTLQTLRNGPVLSGIDDYLTRLKANNPKSASQIDAIRSYNLTPPKTGK